MLLGYLFREYHSFVISVLLFFVILLLWDSSLQSTIHRWFFSISSLFWFPCLFHVSWHFGWQAASCVPLLCFSLLLYSLLCCVLVYGDWGRDWNPFFVWYDRSDRSDRSSYAPAVVRSIPAVSVARLIEAPVTCVTLSLFAMKKTRRKFFPERFHCILKLLYLFIS